MPLYSIETFGELNPFVGQEWLLTNGMGAFAASSLLGCNRRRYHGLLCAATLPPLGRVLALSRVGEKLEIEGRSAAYELSVNHFGQTMHPRGFQHLRNFELDTTAKWSYEIDGIRIHKQVMLVWQRNAVGVRYQIDAPHGQKIRLQLSPFVAMRDFHALRRRGTGQFQVSNPAKWQMIVAEGAHKLHLRADAGEFVPREDWWLGHTYPIETERGLDDSEDLLVPGYLAHEFAGPTTITLWAGLDVDGNASYDWDEQFKLHPRPASRIFDTAAETLVQDKPEQASPTVQRLLHAAANFVVARNRPDGKPGTTILAGYPWFGDWGRDSMISLPGLLLATGRFAEARQLLTLYAEYVSEGMIPNRFDDYNNEPSYNTVDASLWFIHSVFEFFRLSGEKPSLESPLLGACRAIVNGYRAGTRFGIAMDERDGLISAGDEKTQLTWMDAKCGGIAFTPRHGKAVEINALWYNALALLGEEKLARTVQSSFVETFWQNPFRGLYDVVTPDGRKDASIRPNQIFAASLPHSPLSREQQLAIVEVVRRELLTPYGLRTLARSDPNYQGRYAGGPMQRDRAYHNGTVWPWLSGAFLEAYLRTHDRSVDAMRQCRVWLQPLIDHLNQGCIGQISECFEGDDPHRPVGCPAQAWSVAEVLRIAVELGV